MSRCCWPFTSAGAVRAGCGPHQAAVAIDPADLKSVVEQTAAHGLLVDPVLAGESRPQTPVVGWTRTEPQWWE